MLLILVLAALVLATLAVVCLPLLRGTSMIADRGQFDRAIYRDQLSEVERDLARGVLNNTEAASARLEIQRRLLAVDTGPPATAVRSRRSPILASVVGALVVLGAAGLYWQLGAPALPDAPFGGRASNAARADATGRIEMQNAAAQLAEKLQADPTNAQGWLLYARAQSVLGDWQKATDAYRHAIDLGLKSPDVLASYGEVLVLASGGIVSTAAHDAFALALAGDPKNDMARYYMALEDSQAGEARRAIASWSALAADLPEDSPIRARIARGVAEAARAGGIAAPPLPRGTATPPSDEQMAATAQMPQAQRDEMIRGMLSQLAARLQSQPDDLEGWLRLGRSYGVLGDNDKALDAFEHAARLKPGDVAIKLLMFQAMVAGLRPSDPVPPRAMTLLHEVAVVEPDEPSVLWYLGLDAAKGGRAGEARRQWTKLLDELPPGSQDALLVKSALGALPSADKP